MIAAIDNFLKKTDIRFLSEIRITNHEMEIWICFEEEFDDWVTKNEDVSNTSTSSKAL